MIVLPSRSSCWMFAIGQVCVHIKYVSTGKAYWLDATAFAWSDNGLDQIIDSLCNYVFAAASSTCLSSCLVFSKTPRNFIGVMLVQALDRFKISYLHISTSLLDLSPIHVYHCTLLLIPLQTGTFQSILLFLLLLLLLLLLLFFFLLFNYTSWMVPSTQV